MKNKKGKKHSQADRIISKKSKTIEKKTNPFEIHQNREKFNVLNRKTHHSRGMPFASRSQALEKRKQTLGVEYSLKNKSNVFEDKRRAGSTNYMPSKESIYNLNDAEVLTHGGQTLAEIERFDDVAQEEDDMSDTEARLDAKFTEAAHFGGGTEDDRRDRKSIIDELIAESKKRKTERVRDNEEVYDMTEKLDSEWKDLFPVIGKLQQQEKIKPQQDDYDRLVKEMVFAPRGEPTEKLQNEEEIARIEKERLEKLERERLERMKGNNDEENDGPKHKSADDLDDGYFVETVTDENEEGDRVLSYDINGDEAEKADASDVEKSDVGKQGNDSEEEGESESIEEEQSSEEESESDDLEDLKADDSDEEETAINNTNVLKISDDTEEMVTPSKPIAKTPELNPKDVDTLGKIPYTISMPNSFEELMELLDNQSIKVQSIIVDRIIKTNHPRLHPLNKNKMLKLFAYLMQYINDLFGCTNETTIKSHFKLLNELNPHLYDLVQMNPDEGSKCFLEVIKEKYDDYKKNPKMYPKLDTIVFFKIAGTLFPTSDFRHPVVTPSCVFMHQILSQGKIRRRSDVSTGIFLATIVLDFQELSKKFLPSVLNFLHGICYLGIKKSLLERSKPIPPFKKMDNLLLLNGECEENVSVKSLRLTSSDLLDKPIDDEFKVRALNIASRLISDYIKLYDELVGLKYLLDPFESILSRLADEEFLPTSLKENIKSILGDFEKIRLDKKFIFPEPDKKVQPMLRMLEPRFETVLSDRRSMYGQARGAQAEQHKLKHMVKREFKSAKRELRRDNEFLSKVRHKRRQDMDRERQAKVKRIFNEASVQQSEYNALARTKGRKGKF